LVLRRLGRLKDAIASYDNSVKCDPNNYEAWDNRGYALVKLKRYKEAMENFDKALEINPEHVNAVYNKGYCYAVQGKVTFAVDYLEVAIKKNPLKYGVAAKTDPDLDCLRKNKRFQALIGERKK
jgi:tetratricopeptide (TPR) repeat protein